MIKLEDLYFEWLLGAIDPDGDTEGVEYVGGLLHSCDFLRRVGNDINRAKDGADLRKEFLVEFDDANLGPSVTNDLLLQECSWLEMLIALSRNLDFLYDGGVEYRFLELTSNMGLLPLMVDDPKRSRYHENKDLILVDLICTRINENRIEPNGLGGLFPLAKPNHPDQRSIEIWEQASAYFRERLEGVLWTSTN